MRIVPIAVLILATSVPVVVGCRSIAERVEEKALERSTGGQATINDKNGTLSVATDAGTVSIGEGSKVPDDFPKEVALYPGAKATMSFSGVDPKGKKSWTVALETPDTKDKVIAYYKANMSSFTVQSTMDMAAVNTTIYQGTKYTVSVVASGAGGKTTIQETVAPK